MTTIQTSQPLYVVDNTPPPTPAPFPLPLPSIAPTGAPQNLTYSQNPLLAYQEFQSSDAPLSLGGKPTSYTIAPPLPAGLNLDPATGVISGWPVNSMGQTPYTVTAKNSFGSTSTSLAIQIGSQPPPNYQKPLICIAGTQYSIVQQDQFWKDSSLSKTSGCIVSNPPPSQMWSTEFPWCGRTNNVGTDTAYYSDSTVYPYIDPFSIQNNALVITSSPAPAGVKGSTGIAGQTYISGTLSAAPLTYGYFELAGKIPNQNGFWPAFWLITTNWSAPSYAELDVYELFGNMFGLNNISQTYDYGPSNNIQHFGTGSFGVLPDPSKSYHVYGVNWTPTGITFYVDHVPTSKTFPNPASFNGQNWNINMTMSAQISQQVFAENAWGTGESTGNATVTGSYKFYQAYQSTGIPCVGDDLPPSSL